MQQVQSYLEPLLPKHRGGSRCPVCSADRLRTLNTKPLSDAKRLLNTITDITVDWNTYQGVYASIQAQCNKCNHIWTPILYTLSIRPKCPICTDYSNVSVEKAQQRLQHRTDITVDWNTYQATYKPVTAICNKCNHTWRPTFKNLWLTGTGCPKCSGKRISRLETEILEEIQLFFSELTLYQSNRSTIKNDTTNQPYELDIYIPEIKLAIEFNGTYWHSDEKIQQRTDNQFQTAQEYHNHKTNLCEQKGIKLIHISEQDYLDNKEQVLTNLFITIQTRLQVESYLKELNITPKREVTISTYKLDYLIQDKVALDITYYTERNTNTVSKNYHINRTLTLRKHNIRVINLFESHLSTPSMWNVLKDIIKHSIGLNSKKYQARKLKLEVRPALELKPFFQENNIQGYRNAKLAFCLNDPETNETIMSYTVGKAYFGKGRYDAEIARGACKLGCSVAGGASKLWKAIIDYYKDKDLDGSPGQVKTIVYYVDLNYYDGKSMPFLNDIQFITEQAGFWNYWTETNELKNREPARHKLIMQLMSEGKILCIPNAGTQVNVWHRKPNLTLK